jgi:hypothetical protein
MLSSYFNPCYVRNSEPCCERRCNKHHIFIDEERTYLNRVGAENPSPTNIEKSLIARHLNLHYAVIRYWFMQRKRQLATGEAYAVPARDVIPNNMNVLTNNVTYL